MNTRDKIITSSQLSDLGPVRLLAGYFDPLLPETIAALEALHAEAPETRLVAVIDSPPDPLLPPAARAELAASLRAFTYVVASATADLLARAERLPEPREAFLRHVRDRAGRLVKEVR